MTSSLGALRLARTYYYCDYCQEGTFAADEHLGLLDSLTRRARELVVLAGIGCGIGTAIKRLRRFCGWAPSESTVRRICYAEGRRLQAWREQGDDHSLSPSSNAVVDEPSSYPMEPTSSLRPIPQEEQSIAKLQVSERATPELETPGPAQAESLASVRQPSVGKPLEAFVEAEGNLEFLTDGGMVNTLDGWKEIRLALWLKRPAGEPAACWEWSTRELPRPSARAVLIDIAGAEEFGARWRPWASRLGITNPEQLSILADGAEWIWRQAQVQYPGATGVLDLFHAIEHLAEVTRVLEPEREGARQGWLDTGIRALVTEGWSGVCRWVGAVRDSCDDREDVVVATGELFRYLAPHKEHLAYRDRLATGRSIGSGPVESSIKQLVGRRLKQTGARWQPKNAIAMATLCSAELVGDWDSYWQSGTVALAI